MSLPSILKLTPRFREVVWGGRRLEPEFGKPIPAGKPVGEAFELSAVQDMEALVSEGPLAGRSISELILEFGPQLTGIDTAEKYGADFPLLVKWLDAQGDLSIQVHPDDEYVRREDLGRFGKSEAWYVVRSENGRVAAGLKNGAGVDDLRRAIEEGHVEDIVVYHDVSPGDIVCIPPGTVHALCGGVMVYEVQQSSDVTFRLYDYNRPQPDGSLRELHVEQGLAVTDPSVDATPSRVEAVRQVTTEHFTLDRFNPTDAHAHDPVPSFSAVTLLHGTADLQADGLSSTAPAGQPFLIPAHRGFTVKPQEECEYLIATVPP